MNETTLFILIFGDLVAGFLVWLYLKDYFSQFSWWKSALLKSFVYSLFFGIGALGEGGGEPGFMLPAPILASIIVALMDQNLNSFLQNAVLAYGFWVVLLFAFYSACEALRRIRKASGATS